MLHSRPSLPFYLRSSKVVLHVWVAFLFLFIDTFHINTHCFICWIIFNNDITYFTPSFTPSLARTFSQTFLKHHVHQQRQQLKILSPYTYIILLYNSKCSLYIQKLICLSQYSNATTFTRGPIWIYGACVELLYSTFLCLSSPMLIYSLLNFAQPI